MTKISVIVSDKIHDWLISQPLNINTMINRLLDEFKWSEKELYNHCCFCRPNTGVETDPNYYNTEPRDAKLQKELDDYTEKEYPTNETIEEGLPFYPLKRNEEG